VHRAKGEVGVTPEMLVAPPEQVSHDRSLACSAIDRALPLDAYTSHGGEAAASDAPDTLRWNSPSPQSDSSRRETRHANPAIEFFDAETIAWSPVAGEPEVSERILATPGCLRS
jgi:hypothetical protein